VQGGRNLISGQSVDVALVYGLSVAMALAFMAWAVRGMRAAEKAG
jgi:hypothetical protein